LPSLVGLGRLTRRRFYGAKAYRQGTAPPTSSVPRPLVKRGAAGEAMTAGVERKGRRFGGEAKNGKGSSRVYARVKNNYGGGEDIQRARNSRRDSDDFKRCDEHHPLQRSARILSEVAEAFPPKCSSEVYLCIIAEATKSVKTLSPFFQFFAWG